MSTIPDSLNWVEKRAACNVAEVFNRIALEIQDDIIAINAIKYKELYFHLDALADGTLVIGQPNRHPRMTVSIGVADKEIVVIDQATPGKWSVHVGLNDEGRCVLKGENGTELETWQFRKRALDTLFFEK